MGKQWLTYLGAPKSLQMVTAAMKSKDACSLEESYDQPRKHIKKWRHHFANNVLSSQSYGFSSSYVWVWELDHKEGWAPKNWCFWTVVLEKTLESALDCQEIKLKEISLNIHWKDWCWSWNSNILATWCKNWLIGKDPDAGKDWRQEEKGATENEMVGWHHRLDGHEFEQVPRVGDGQGSLVSMELQRVIHDWVTELNWTDPNFGFDLVNI